MSGASEAAAHVVQICNADCAAELIESGGQAKVYKQQHPEFGAVAVKVIPNARGVAAQTERKCVSIFRLLRQAS